MSDATTNQTQDRKTYQAQVKANAFETLSEKYFAIQFKFAGELPDWVEGKKTFKVLADRQTWNEKDFEDDETVREVVVDWTAPKPNKTEPTIWLVEWNGKKKAPWEPGQKKDGFAPKTPAEVHGPHIAAMASTCAEGTFKTISSMDDFAKSFEVAYNSVFDRYLGSLDVVTKKFGNPTATEGKEAA